MLVYQRVNWLGGGFKYFLFSPLFGDMIQFDEHIFQMGWNHQLEYDFSRCPLEHFPRSLKQKKAQGKTYHP